MQGANKQDIDILYVDATEAEVVKLSSNTYLAMCRSLHAGAQTGKPADLQRYAYKDELII